MDPWNGSGTTTTEALRAGFDAIGIDLNPVATLVASAKLAHVEDASHLGGILERLPRRPPALRSPGSEPLLAWLPERTAAHARCIVNAVLDMLAKSSDGQVVDPLSKTPPPLASFLLLAVVRAVKALAHVRRGSNPTWVKPGAPPCRQDDNLYQLVVNNVSEMWVGALAPFNGSAQIHLGEAQALPIADHSVDVVLGSPPYCTRLDYVVKTSVELATLGLSADSPSFSALRRRMTGTPLSRPAPLLEPRYEWGEAVGELLQKIRTHPSPDSSSYYYKSFWQYFDDMHRAFNELRRVLKRSHGALLVIQSSYYKDVSINLPSLLVDLWRAGGTEAVIVAAFPVKRVLTSINSRAQRHRGDRMYTESLIALEC